MRFLSFAFTTMRRKDFYLISIALTPIVGINISKAKRNKRKLL
jgi:hypothetical protein